MNTRALLLVLLLVGVATAQPLTGPAGPARGVEPGLGVVPPTSATPTTILAPVPAGQGPTTSAVQGEERMLPFPARRGAVQPVQGVLPPAGARLVTELRFEDDVSPASPSSATEGAAGRGVVAPAATSPKLLPLGEAGPSSGAALPSSLPGIEGPNSSSPNRRSAEAAGTSALPPR